MNILEEIILKKKAEVEKQKKLVPVKILESSEYFHRPVISMKESITNKQKSGVIAEFKRRSPSKGIFKENISVEKTTVSYVQAGASALSVLTDEKYFGGKNEDLLEARKFNHCPILRKDFIIDEYQVIEARSIGADAILLIAAVLNETRIRELSNFAKALGLEIIFEIHDRADLDKLNGYTDIVGVNNRNLKSFETNIQTSIELFPLIPEEFLKISESGIHSPEIAFKLKGTGYDGFLIGEQFMTNADPGKACADFITQLNQLYASEDLRAPLQAKH